MRNRPSLPCAWIARTLRACVRSRLVRACFWMCDRLRVFARVLCCECLDVLCEEEVSECMHVCMRACVFMGGCGGGVRVRVCVRAHARV